uniref:50S ribosomal protein L22 n=1 Tax=Angiostrongylus cantonensis TaxID=6313 RepID=A0A0K0DMB6_ANGCA
MKAESSKVTKRRLSPETIELIRGRGIARATGNHQPKSSGFGRSCKGREKHWQRPTKLREFQTNMIALRPPDGTVTACRRAMEEIIHE